MSEKLDSYAYEEEEEEEKDGRTDRQTGTNHAKAIKTVKVRPSISHGPFVRPNLSCCSSKLG